MFFGKDVTKTSQAQKKYFRVRERQGRSKLELENLQPRTQDLARFWNYVLFQAEPRKMMWWCDEIVTFVPSFRKIVTFLEVLKKKNRNLVASHRTWNVTKCVQVSSMKWTTKLSRILIYHQRSTVILCKWILIDRRYPPYSPVGESLSTVYIDSDWSTGLINRWIGIDIQIDVGTIFQHSCDHDSFADVYPGPFLIFGWNRRSIKYRPETKERPQISNPSFWKRDRENVFLRMI